MQFTSDLITGGLVAVFSAPGSALAIAFLMLLACVGILVWVRLTRIGPIWLAAGERIWRLGGGGVMPRRHWQGELKPSASVAEIMERPGPGSASLVKAWYQYAATRRTVQGRLRATTSADLFFDSPAETAVLGWWANLFVAIGLVFTFLGVVAALTTATATIGEAGDPAATQSALADLLRITATKFWTSIAGVGSSILLRVFERRWRSGLERRYLALAELLDHTAEPIDTPELMVRQLEVLESMAHRLAR